MTFDELMKPMQLMWVVVGKIGKRTGHPYVEIMQADPIELPPGCAAFATRVEAKASHRRRSNARPLWLD